MSNNMYSVFKDTDLLTIILKMAGYKPMQKRCMGKTKCDKRCKNKPFRHRYILCQVHRKQFYNNNYDFNIFYKNSTQKKT